MILETHLGSGSKSKIMHGDSEYGSEEIEKVGIFPNIGSTKDLGYPNISSAIKSRNER